MKMKRLADRENKLGLSGPSTYFRFFIFLPFNGSQAISSTSIILFVTTSNTRKVLYHTSLQEDNAVQKIYFGDNAV